MTARTRRRVALKNANCRFIVDYGDLTSGCLHLLDSASVLAADGSA